MQVCAGPGCGRKLPATSEYFQVNPGGYVHKVCRRCRAASRRAARAPRDDSVFGDMVDSLRFEAAFKYRQLVEHIRSNDIQVSVPLWDIERMTGITLPTYLYDPDNG
jgi:hypothetical protein